MQLLLGFSPDDLARPETFEVLIDYLAHDKDAIRNLAAWHLVRIVPDGKSIGFTLGGTPADHAKTVQAWRKLIPPGELPRSPKSN